MARPSLHRALQLELGDNYRDAYQVREGYYQPTHGERPYDPTHTSWMSLRLPLYLRQSFQASCYRRGIPYTERIRQLMLADLADHPVE